MLRLRGHHLVCLHFFRGGASCTGEFMRALGNIGERLASGEAIEVVDGGDDLCAACPSFDGSACRNTASADTEVRGLDASALAQVGARAGDAASWEELARRVYAIPEKWFVEYCEGCEWASMCRRTLTTNSKSEIRNPKQ